ncbi:methylamine utilization protein [Colwelliaceae bacterium 6441]
MNLAFGQIIIKVIDQNNNPLPNAVVEYILEKPLPKEIERKKNAPYIMDQVDKSFSPYVLIVPKGKAVIFPNSDDIRHHVYSFSKAKTFELKLYAGEPKSPIRFNDEGVVVLGCNIHDAMVGYIYVSENEAIYKTDALGEIKLAGNQPIKQLLLWHPNAKKGVDYRKLYEKKEITAMGEALVLQIEIIPPPKRDTFEDQF